MKAIQTLFLYIVIFCVLTFNVLLFFKGPQTRQVQDIPRGLSLLERLKNIEHDMESQAKSHNSLLERLQFERKRLESDIHRLNKDFDQKPPARVTAPAKALTYDPRVVIPVLVIACNRITIKQNLDQLIRLRPSAERFPIVVSQDCGHEPTANVIRQYGSKLTHIQQPDLSDPQLPWSHRKWKGYYKISRHYKWALNQVFYKFNYDAVIIVEDDLDVSPDFFEYFSSLYPIIKSDPSLWCVSAWNDNGKENLIENTAELLYRTDFFPGLGWMLQKKTWLELGPKWPVTFWDDWMRHPDQRKGRSCIRPEVSRTHTFGKVGVSKGQFFDKHLKFIKLNSKFVNFSSIDLSYLKKKNYDTQFRRMVYSLPVVSENDLRANKVPGSTALRIEYTEKKPFQAMAKRFGIMDDFKSGVPRTGINGIVPFIFQGRRVFVAPPEKWSGYDLTWN